MQNLCKVRQFVSLDLLELNYNYILMLIKSWVGEGIKPKSSMLEIFWRACTSVSYRLTMYKINDIYK
jgi:hypothetical protein